VLAGIRESGATWAAPFFWRALLARHLADPVGETARDRRSAARRQRGVLEEARLLGEQLYSLPDQVVAASFDRFIVPWRNRPGGMLLGKDLVAVLLQGALGPLRGEPKPLTAERIARYSLERRPPGGLDDLAARIFLADRLEREKRWEQAAGLYRRVLLAFHLGRVSSRGLEVVIGRAQPEAGRFPLLRLLARPFLLEARAALAAGKEEAAEKLLERALAEGEADSTVRRAVAEIRRSLEARGR